MAGAGGVGGNETTDVLHPELLVDERLAAVDDGTNPIPAPSENRMQKADSRWLTSDMRSFPSTLKTIRSAAKLV